ncbi:MAG: pyruvate formate lyase family protein [Dehalococcoidia bacterium]
MVQMLEKKSSLLGRVLAVEPTPRVERLRQRYFDRKLVASIDRDRIEVRVMEETEGEPMAIRKAKVFAAVVRELPINILSDELLVGWFDPMPESCPLPVKIDPTLEERLDTLSTRERNPISISHEQKKQLKEEIIPYWRGKGRWERSRMSSVHDELLPPEVRRSIGGLRAARVFDEAGKRKSRVSGLFGAMGTMGGTHVGHFVADNEKVLEKGFLGIKKEAAERLGRVDLADPEELRKIPFLKAVIIVMEAAAEIGTRFAANARGLAADEQDAGRKSELLKIAEVCDRVPAGPARTFYEALQSVWFIHILHWWETRETAAISPGRVDQYLYPYYESDVREGRMTRKEAQELIDCFLFRFSWFVYYSATTPEGYTSTALNGAAHHIDVGGLRGDGSDATNDLSYMFLEGMMHTRLTEPNFGVLVHSKTPEAFLIKACQLAALGAGHPMFLNHDDIVANLLGRGTIGGPPVTLALARESGAIGCNEPAVPGMDSGYTVGHGVSLAQVLELVLTNGWSRHHRRRLGAKTGDPRQFKSFGEVQAAFRKQLSWLADKASTATNIGERLLAEMDPTAYQSALIADCIENGTSREAGGARYNFGTFFGTNGVPDVGDSLTAIRKLVFDEERITMGDLCDALDDDFEGRENLRRLLLSAPKFGNDDDYADEQTVWAMQTFCQEVAKHRNTRGGYRMPVLIPLTGYVTGGAVIGALPSGRRAGEPLADSISPTRGNDLNGPTAVLKSVGKINNAEVFAGQTLNMRLDPSAFNDDYGFKRLADFIRTLVDQKIHHVQFTVVSSDTLRAAQEEPSQHKDVMVRVAGYVAPFVELPRAVQDSVIARTEHSL